MWPRRWVRVGNIVNDSSIFPTAEEEAFTDLSWQTPPKIPHAGVRYLFGRECKAEKWGRTVGIRRGGFIFHLVLAR